MSSSGKELYGDQTHLLFFRVSSSSYDAILESVIYTITSRAIQMPFMMTEVYGRHRFLGGEHHRRDPVLHLKSPPKWKADETEAEKLAREFAELFMTYSVDRRDVELQKRLDDFARFACKRGDFIDAGGGHYFVKAGVYDIEAAASNIFHTDPAAKKGGESRRGSVPHNKRKPK